MLRTFSLTLALLSLFLASRPAWTEDLDDDDFAQLMSKRKLPTPQTLGEFADQVARMRRLGADNAEIAERMSIVIDRRLLATNKPQNESLFNPAKEGAIADNKRRWQEVDDVINGNDGLPGKPLPDGRKGAAIAGVAWKNGVGNCGESANVAFEVLRRAGIQARIFNSANGGGHEFVVMGLSEKADPDDPSTWGEDARVVDGWIGRSLTPEEAADHRHVFNGRAGQKLVSDQTAGYYDPDQQKKLTELGEQGVLAVTVKDEAGKPVAAALVQVQTDAPQEKPSTGQGIANFRCYPGKVTVHVVPPSGDLLPGDGEAYVETRRGIPLTIVLKKKKDEQPPGDVAIKLDAPAEGADGPIAGTVSDPSIKEVTVMVNGEPQTLPVSDGKFSIPAAALKAGENIIQALAGGAKSPLLTHTSKGTPTAAKAPSWDGMWCGKIHYDTTLDGKAAAKDSPADLTIKQEGAVLHVSGGAGVSMDFQLNPKSPYMATYTKSENVPATGNDSRGGQVTATITLTLKDGQVTWQSNQTYKFTTRAAPSKPWQDHLQKTVGKGELTVEH